MKYITKALFALAFSLMALGPIEAQERLKVDFYTRFDYNYVDGTDASTGEFSGFKGRFLMVRAFGDFGNGFSYAISQRLNKINRDTRTFDSTDWVYLTYTTPDGGWDFTGGKVVQWVGAFEYDDNPVEIPFFSQYANHCNPYLLGGIVGKFIGQNDKLSFVFTESPYDTPDKNLFGYALEWRGHHGIWSPIYTASLYEQDAFGPSYQFAFGNEFKWGKWEIKYDHLQRFNGNRSSWHHYDFTAAAQCRYALTDHWNLLAKATCDINDNEVPFDLTVGTGTNNQMYSAGFEFYPDKEHDIKLYGLYIRSVGDFEYLQNDFTRIALGVKWKFNMITIK